ncbi:MAG: hypothetical protein ACXVA9_11335, partial [Bdellovibrionales bacterium]
MRSLFLISALVFAAPTAQAALTITSISGVSNSVIVPNTTAPTTPGGTTTPATGTASATVYGGTAGHLATPGQPSCAAITDFRQPCDSCGLAVCADNTNATPGVDQAPLCACNRRRVYDGLIISIAVTRAANETPQGPIKAVVSTGGVSGTQEMQYVTTPSANVSYVDFTWQNLCSKLQTTPATTSCEGANGTVVVTIFSDKNNDGIATGEDQVNVTFKIVSPGADYNIFGEPNSDGGVGDFLPFPGDDRIYLTRLDTTTNFPNLAYGSVGTAVKVLLSNVSLDKATPKDRVEPETDLAVASGTAELDQDYIDDVKNGTTYYVRLAVVDQANNMVQFFPDNLGTDKAGVDNSANCNGATANSTCP